MQRTAPGDPPAPPSPAASWGRIGELDDDQLVDAYPWPRPSATQPGTAAQPWIRAVMVCSLDGRAALHGRSAGLGNDDDRRMFQVLRDDADVVLVGASTVRNEGYGGVGTSAASARRRRARGADAPPPLAVVTGGGLDAGLGIFTRTLTPAILLTTRAGAQVPTGLSATVIPVGGPDDKRVDLAAAIAELAGRGLRRIHCEGGPSLLGALVTQGLVDELCLTLAPVTVGSDAVGLLGGAVHAESSWELAAARSGGSHLFLRYLRTTAPG